MITTKSTCALHTFQLGAHKQAELFAAAKLKHSRNAQCTDHLNSENALTASAITRTRAGGADAAAATHGQQ